MTITSNEAAVLQSIATNCFNVLNYDVPTCYEEANAEIWADCINDAKIPSGLTGKILSGVCGSLARKGLIKTYESGREATMLMTEEGFNAYRDFYG